MHNLGAALLRGVRLLRSDPNRLYELMMRSIERMQGFLRELVELTGQPANARSGPVLELQLAEVFTVTSLLVEDKQAYLLITALLPPHQKADNPHFMFGRPDAAAVTSPSDIEYLWHADEGRYVGIRKMPISDLPDEPSVFDAILETADQAAVWYSSLT